MARALIISLVFDRLRSILRLESKLRTTGSSALRTSQGVLAFADKVRHRRVLINIWQHKVVPTVANSPLLRHTQSINSRPASILTTLEPSFVVLCLFVEVNFLCELSFEFVEIAGVDFAGRRHKIVDFVSDGALNL